MEGSAPNKLLISDDELDDVRLIVKSANQQFEDLIVHSKPSWTIRRLKLHLCQVYPSNPTVPEQKLIYSGQLLSDELILKEILRSYKDVETENHIFHLVYTPKISATKPKLPEKHPLDQQPQISEKPITPVIASSSSTDGLRHRNVTSSTSSTTPSINTETPVPTTAATAPNTAYPFSIPQLSGAAGCINNYPNVTPFSFPAHFYNGAVSEQQVAMQNWVQQIYANYMEQCLKMANPTVNAAQRQPNAPSIPMFMPFPQYMPPSFPIPQATTSTTASNAPPIEIEGPSTSQAARATSAPRVVPVIPEAPAAPPQPNVAQTVGTAASPAPVPAPAPAENVEQPQPRFPNIVQEEQDNRDWLDSFYSITRLLALLTLVYFYSSPLRCLVVAIIAIGIYLYHIGFFQVRRPAQANNRNINNNQNINNNNAPADVPVAPNAPDAPQPASAVVADPSVPAESEPLITSISPPEAETTSLIAFVRTFVVSFFASLLPETPAL